MSEKKEVMLLEQFKQQLEQFKFQRDQAQTNLNQIIGAVYACEVMIKQHENALSKPGHMYTEKVCDHENPDQGGTDNVQTDNGKTE